MDEKAMTQVTEAEGKGAPQKVLREAVEKVQGRLAAYACVAPESAPNGYQYASVVMQEAAALLQFLWERCEAAERRVRYEPVSFASGDTFADMATECRKGPLYRIGDAILVWVNEGDILARGERVAALAESKVTP